MTWSIQLPGQSKDVAQETLTVANGESYTVEGTETYTDADIDGTLNVPQDATLNLTSTTITPYEEREVMDVNPVKAANRYAREAEVDIWDPKKNKLPAYEDYQPIELLYNGELEWGGFVIDQSYDESETQIYCLSHDFWLKKETIAREFQDTRISDVIQTLIEDESNLIYDPELVDVGDDIEITQTYKETLDSVFSDLSEASIGENYGATNDRRFFFRREETERASTDFERGRYLSTSWDNESRKEINRIVLYYNDGENSVVAEDKTRQKEIEDKLGSDDGNGVETARIDKPNITEFAPAERAAQTILSKQVPILVGELETWNVQDLEPGDVTTVVDPDNDIDGEYVVAEVNHTWAEANVLVATNTEGVLDILSDLSEDVSRVDLKGASVGADSEQVINIDGSRASIDVSISADGTSLTTRLTNIARDKIREGWNDEGTISVSEIALGDSGTNLSRTNDSLESELTRNSASESLDGDTGVTYSQTFTQTGVQEVGLFDSDGDLIVRGVSDSALDLDGSVSVSISVSDDASFDRGVITTTGQESIRDILADNAPSLPTQYAYGSDATTPSVSDTSLVTQENTQDLSSLLVADADTTTEWEDGIEEAPNTPVGVLNGELSALQSRETYDSIADLLLEASEGAGGPINDDAYNDGRALVYDEDGHFGVYGNYELDYTIPADNVEFGARLDAETASVELTGRLVDDDNDNALGQVQISNGSGSDLLWYRSGDGLNRVGEWTGGDIPPGNYKIEIEATTSGNAVNLDVVTMGDDRFNYSFPNPTASENNGGILDGPEEYPDSTSISLGAVSTRRDVTEASIQSTWNDITGNQYIEISPDGNTFDRTNNSETASTTFGENSTNIYVNFGFDRFGSGGTSIPATGFNGQSVDLYELYSNPDAIIPVGIGSADIRSVIPNNELDGVTLREGAQLDSNNNALTRSIFSATEMNNNQLISNERIRFDVE